MFNILFAYPSSIISIQDFCNLDEGSIWCHVCDPVIWFSISFLIEHSHSSHTYSKKGVYCLDHDTFIYSYWLWIYILNWSLNAMEIVPWWVSGKIYINLNWLYRLVI